MLESPSILIADSNLNYLSRLCSAIFRQISDANIVSAPNLKEGRASLNKLNNTRFDIAYIQVNLGGPSSNEDGYKLLDSIRKNIRQREVITIAYRHDICPKKGLDHAHEIMKTKNNPNMDVIEIFNIYKRITGNTVSSVPSTYQHTLEDSLRRRFFEFS